MKRKNVLIGLAIVAVVLAAYFGLSAAVNRYVENRLLGWASEALIDDAEINFSSTEAGVLRGKIRLGEFALMRKSGDDTLWSVTASEVELRLKPLLFTSKDEHSFTIRHLDLTMPRVDIRRENPDFNVFRSAGEKAQKAAENTEIKIDRLSVHSGQLHYLKGRPGGISVRYSATASEARLRKGDLSAESYNFRLTDLAYTDAEGVYRTEVRSAIIRHKAPEVELIGIKTGPAIDAESFKERFPFRKSMISGETGRVSVFGLRGNLKDSLMIGTVKIDRPVWSIERDNSLPLPDRTMPMPQEALADLGIHFQADSILLVRGALDIQISDTHRKLPASLRFRQVNAEVTGVGNIDRSAPAFTARAYGVFEDQTETALYTEYRYGAEHPWKLRFTANELNLVRLTPLLEAAVRVEIQSGEMKSLDLKLDGNGEKTEGRIDFMYENLVFDIASKNENNSSRAGHFFSETLGKLLYRKSHEAGDGLETVTFHTERDSRKGFTGQWTDALLEGATRTVVRIDQDRAAGLGEKIKDIFSRSDK